MNELINNVKSSNPKDAVGTKRVPFSTVSAPVVAEIGLAMLEGALKYGRHNYREIGVRSSVYYDAAIRHLSAWWEGQDIDPDSGLPHLAKALASIMVIRDAQMCEKVVDDRPPPHKDNWQKTMNEFAAKLIDKFPEPKEAHINNGT